MKFCGKYCTAYCDGDKHLRSRRTPCPDDGDRDRCRSVERAPRYPSFPAYRGAFVSAVCSFLILSRSSSNNQLDASSKKRWGRGRASERAREMKRAALPPPPPPMMWRSIRRSSIALLMDVRFSSSSCVVSASPPLRRNVDLHNLFSLSLSV